MTGPAAETGPRHYPYWNRALQEDFCRADGEPWPCLHYRQNRPPRCKCSHVRDFHGSDRSGRAMCFSAACGCATYRPQENEQ